MPSTKRTHAVYELIQNQLDNWFDSIASNHFDLPSEPSEGELFAFDNEQARFTRAEHIFNAKDSDFLEGLPPASPFCVYTVENPTTLKIGFNLTLDAKTDPRLDTMFYLMQERFTVFSTLPLVLTNYAYTITLNPTTDTANEFNPL